MIEQARALLERIRRSAIFRDSSFVLGSNLIGQAISLIVSVVLARGLGKEGYSLIILAMTIVNTVAQFLDVHTSEGLIKFVGGALARDDHREAITFWHVGLSINALIATVTMAVLLFTNRAAVTIYPQVDELLRLANIFMLSIPFTTLEKTFSVMPNIFKRFRLLAGVEISNNVLRLICLAIGLWLGGINGVMWGYVIAALLTFTVWTALGSVLILRNIHARRGTGYRAAWRQFLPVAFHTSLTESFKSLFANATVLVLGALRPAGEVSFYRIAESAVKVSTLAVTPVRLVLFPTLNEAWTRGQHDRVRMLIRSFTLYGALLSAGAAVFYLLLGRWLVILLYTVEYSPAVSVLYILAAAHIIDNALLWVRPAAISGDRPGLLTYTQTFNSLLRVSLLVPLTYFYGADGAAWALLITMALYAVMVALYIAPQLDLWHPLRRRRPTP